MSSLEKRLLERVQPLKNGKQGITPVLPSTISTQLSELPHNHQKGKQCRTCRLLRRLAKTEKEKQFQQSALETVKEVGVGSVAAILLGVGEVAKEFVGGVFKVGEAVAGNPDPVSQGIAIGGGIVALAWFIEAYPELAHLLRLDSLGFKNLGNSIGLKLGRDDTNGLYGIEAVDGAGIDYGDRWFVDTKARNGALILLSGGVPSPSGVYPKGPIGFIQDNSAVVGYKQTSRKYPGGSIYFMATPPADNPDGVSAVAQWRMTAPQGTWYIIVGQLPGNSWLVVNRNTIPFSDADFTAQANALVPGTAYQTQVIV